MSSDDSEDEPLSVLAALKRNKSELEILPVYSQSEGSFKKVNLENKYDVSITIQPLSQNESNVVERPTDVWLYLTDFNVTGPYTCLLCSEWFLNRNRIVIHYVVDHKKEYCGICRYLLPDRIAWLKHQKFHLPWKCSLCEDKFDDQRELRKHFGETHNLVHCWFCTLRVPNNEEYEAHLFQKHLVTKIRDMNGEKIWDLDCKVANKFQCLLCSKLFNVGKEFADHFVSYHHVTLKCFMYYVSGIDLPFKIKGIDVSPQFVESELKSYETFGYVDFVKSLKVKEEATIEEVPITVDCEPELNDLSENQDDSDDVKLSEEFKGYKGVKDFDITLLEVVVTQKCFYDYINTSINNVQSNIMPVSSDICYTNLSTEMKPINCCFCSEVFTRKSTFETHITRMHCVKTKPMFWCRVCDASFDCYSELEVHSKQELGEFEDLWICQFCDKEFDGREETRKHLTEHWDEIEYDNCFSPHLGFKCKFCSTLFWNENERELHHVNVHLQKNSREFYYCTLCGDHFGDKVFFIHHYMENHDPYIPYLLKCCLCSNVAQNVEEMRVHFQFNHSHAVKLYCCMDHCQYKPFSARKALVMHLKTFHNPNQPPQPATCQTCGLEFSTSKACSLHALKAHGPGRFNCSLCKTSLQTRDERGTSCCPATQARKRLSAGHSVSIRKIHYLFKHPDSAQYQCKLCDKAFQHKSSLYMHKQQHTPHKKDYTCDYCGKTFLKKDSYREHIMIHEAPRHACSYCPMRFVQRSNMLRHERRHTGEKPYACKFCPRTFADKGACNSHARTHVKSTSFPCVYCGQTFRQKSKLTYHIRKHTGENLETCSICSKMFTSACSLREHMRVHQRMKMKKTIKCPLCENMYKDERDMLRHMRNTHTAKYKCPLCRKTLCSPSALREHVLTHSRLKSFHCKMCPKTYHAKKSVVIHLETHHGLKPPIFPKIHYTQLDPKECNLGLSDDVIEKIFSKNKKELNTDLLIGDYVSFNKGIQPTATQSADESHNEGNQSMEIQVKLEPDDEDEEQEIAPPDFVNVKIEYVEDEQRSEAEMD